MARGFQRAISKVKSLKKDKTASSVGRAQESSEEVQEWLTKITQSVQQSQRDLSNSTSKPRRTAPKPKKTPNSQKRKSNSTRKGS